MMYFIFIVIIFWLFKDIACKIVFFKILRGLGLNVFWCFQGDQKGALGRKELTEIISLRTK